MSGWTPAEELIFGLAVVAIVLGLAILAATKAPRRPVEPPPPPPVVYAPPPPTLSPAEAAAARHVQATGVPVDFIQPHPMTGLPAMYRATPSPDGRTVISEVPPVA